MYISILLPLVLALSQSSYAFFFNTSPVNLTTSDAVVQFSLGKIMEMYAQHGDVDPRGFNVLNATRMDVSGDQLYGINMHVTSNRKDDICTINLWQRSGGKMEVTSGPFCMAYVSKKRGVGAGVPVNPADSDVINALTFATTTFNKQTQTTYLSRPSDDSYTVSSQVVSGLLYHFRGVMMAETTCLKSDSDAKTGDVGKCSLKASGMRHMCDFDVWYQSWMQPQYQLTHRVCSILI